VRYEVLVNHEEFDYLVKNELYNLEGQEAFSKKADDNDVLFPISDAVKKTRGAIEIKLAWKELGANDDRSRFYVTRIKAKLAEPLAPGQIEPPTREFHAGLVGMHIAMRTKSSPEWIWATFEQIDNVRQNYDSSGKAVHPNFYDPNHFVPLNQLPPKNAILDSSGLPLKAGPSDTATTWIESLTRTPVQLARIPIPTQGSLNPLDDELARGAAELNRQVQGILGKLNSPFRYYELIGTQWPVHPNAPAFAGGDGSAPESITHKTPGDVVPVFLVNTTMESYFEKGLQQAGPLEQDDRLPNGADSIDKTMVYGSESCVGCHYSAGICIGFKTGDGGTRTPIFGENNHFGKTGGANFSWLLQIEAHSKMATRSNVAPASDNPANRLDIKKYLKPSN
jgi:hypothetical protein